MQRRHHSFAAPWGRQVKATTLLVAGVLAIVAALPWILSRGEAIIPGVVASLGALAVLAGSAISGVTGYVVLPDVIEVRRIGWTTRLTRSGLRSVEVAPGVMRSSLRVFGNGGLFGLTGHFRNKRLGAYRALVTDPDRTVILHYDDRRVVISPDRPAEFAHAVGVPVLAADPPSATSGNEWKGLRWIALIPVLVFSGIAVVIYTETRPMDVQLDSERLHVDGGFYEIDLPLTRIRGVELRESRPRIERRTNGFAAGSTLRGYFVVEGFGRTRVFSDAATGPNLVLRTEDGPIMLSLGNASQTRELAEALRVRSPQR